MYSVVLMMAVTTGVDAPDHGKGYSCSGCYGSCSGYSSCSGCIGSGHGCKGGGLFGRHKHHSTGCCGYSSCVGSCNGYTGCTGYVGCTGYTGCNGYSSCVGTCVGSVGAPVYAAPAPGPAPMPVPAPLPKPKEESRLAAPATLVVSLPADARLSVDDAATTSTSASRVFTTPELPVGRIFHYTLKAEFSHEGKPVTVSKTVAIRAGEQTAVNIGTADLVGVASR